MWLDREGRWRVSLTDSGRRLVADLFARYPAPVTLLTVPAPKLFALAVRHRNAGRDAAEDMDQAAAAGVCQAATYFDESVAGGTFEAFASWHVRAAVGRWLRQHGATAHDVALSGHEADPGREASPVADALAGLDEADRKALRHPPKTVAQLQRMHQVAARFRALI